MKKINVVYRKDQESLAKSLCRILCSDDYEITLYPLKEPNDIKSYYFTWMEQLPNLIFTIDLAGFEYRTLGGDTCYTKFPINTFHYIHTDIEAIAAPLCGVMNFTMKFIVKDSNTRNYLKTNYPRIYDITEISSLEQDLPSILAQLDWLYP